jgi:hypothetical protein
LGGASLKKWSDGDADFPRSCVELVLSMIELFDDRAISMISVEVRPVRAFLAVLTTRPQFKEVARVLYRYTNQYILGVSLPAFEVVGRQSVIDQIFVADLLDSLELQRIAAS